MNDNTHDSKTKPPRESTKSGEGIESPKIHLIISCRYLGDKAASFMPTLAKLTDGCSNESAEELVCEVFKRLTSKLQFEGARDIHDLITGHPLLPGNKFMVSIYDDSGEQGVGWMDVAIGLGGDPQNAFCAETIETANKAKDLMDDYINKLMIVLDVEIFNPTTDYFTDLIKDLTEDK